MKTVIWIIGMGCLIALGASDASIPTIVCGSMAISALGAILTD